MGQQFCTSCGAKLNDGTRFCENCGAKVEEIPAPTASSPEITETGPSSAPETAPDRKFPVVIVAVIIIGLVALGAAAFFLLPMLQGGPLPALPGQTTTIPTTIPTPEPTTPVTTVITTAPTPTPEPFPDAYRIKEIFSFNEGKYASRATVYRYWINETYHWHNDMDNKYYTEPVRPAPGYKYVFIFVNIENIGTDAYPYPKSNLITLISEGNEYHVDTSHYLPDKSGNLKATPIEVQEIEFLSDYFNLEHVEDYGYSHATMSDFIYPGQGNAIDGYLIYRVPESLDPKKTYVHIVFDGQDQAVWKLT
jgi:hypothetical protein